MEKNLRVEELRNYGGLTISKEAINAQKKIMLDAFKSEFGTLGMIGIFIKMFFRASQLKKAHRETYKRAKKWIGKEPTTELLLLSAMFLVISSKKGREEAYEFFRMKVLSKFGKVFMDDWYEIEKLKRCPGDVFDNFKKFNIAAFKGISDLGQFKVEHMKDEPNRLEIKVMSCANCDLFKEMGVPELGKFACDNDLFGYKAISDDVQCDFRRLKTIGKGDDCCMFEFYRKGHAPDNEHLNK